MRKSIAFLAALIVSTACWAQTQNSVRFDIPSQPLADALRAVGSQVNLNVMFDPPLVAGRKAPAIKAQMTSKEVLAALLKGTGIKHEFVNETTVVLVGEGKASKSSLVSQPTEIKMARVEGDDRLQQVAGSSAAAGVRLSENSPASKDAENDSNDALPRAKSPSADRPVNELVVVDSRLRGSRGRDFAQPVRVITREQIVRSGAGNIAQVLNSLPEVSISASGTIAQDDFGATTVQLRGQGTALVLINGRRVATSAYQARSDYFDLSTIPLSMVERIEVLTAGSSAIYGGDGLSGVVNVVLKERASGLESSLRHGSAEGYDETQLAMSFGYARDKYSLMLTGTFARNSELQGSERAITADQDHRRFGASDNRSTAANPGNIYSLTGENLPGLDAPYAGVPEGSAGVGLVPEDFLATAGTLNRTSTLASASLLSPQKRLGLSLYGRYRPAQNLELFTEMLYSQTDLDQFSNDLLTLTGGEFGSWIVSADNPFNPFGVDVGVDYLFEIDRFRQRLSQKYERPLVGLRFDAGDWDVEVAAWMSRDEQYQDRTGIPDFIATNEALASADPAQALNVFQDGPGGSRELIASVLSPIPRRGYLSELQAANLWLRGTPFRLPSGEVQVALGAEHARSTLRYEPTIGSDQHRRNHAALMEARMPLWPRELVVVSLAARYDDYSDFGSQVSPGFGIEIRPAESVLLRASYNESFKPPILYQLYFPQFTFPTFISDPQLGASYLASQRFGGNQALQPEFGRSRTLGVVLEPESMASLRVALTWWNISSDNSATGLSPQLIVNNESLYPNRVTRDPVNNRVTLVDNTFINFGSIDQDGYDIDMRWSQRTSAGEFIPQFSASYTNSYRVQLVPGGSITDRVGIAGYSPRWKINTSLQWRGQERFEATVSGRYVDTYRDFAPLLDGTYRRLGGVTHLDANVRYELGGVGGWLSGAASAYVSLGALNLLDRKPEFSNYPPYGFDPGQYDLRGRLWYAEIGVSL